MRKSVSGKVSDVVLSGVKDNNVTLIEHRSVISGQAIGHLASGINERLSAETKDHVLLTVITRPVKNYFGPFLDGDHCLVVILKKEKKMKL